MLPSRKHTYPEHFISRLRHYLSCLRRLDAHPFAWGSQEPVQNHHALPSLGVLLLVVAHSVARVLHRGSNYVFIPTTSFSDIWDIYLSVPVCLLALAFFGHAVLGEFHDKRTAGA